RRTAARCSSGGGCVGSAAFDAPLEWSASGNELARLLALTDLRPQVVLLADLVDQRQLGLEEIDVLFGILQDVDDDLAADIVLGRFAKRDRSDQRGARLVLP